MNLILNRVLCACRHLEKQNELLTKAHSSMSHELHKLQVHLWYFLSGVLNSLFVLALYYTV